MNIIDNVPRSSLLYSSAAISAASTAGYLLYKKIFSKEHTREEQIKHELITFTGLTTTTTCALSSAVVYFAHNGDVATHSISSSQFLLSAGCMLVPAIVAKELEWYYSDTLEEKKSSIWTTIKRAFSNKVTWFGVALIGALTVDTIIISGLLPGNSFSRGSEYLVNRISDIVPIEQRAQVISSISNIEFSKFIPRTLANVVLGGVTINALLAYMEERGWRDFMYKRLNFILGKDNLWTHSALTGISWGLFHAPLVLCGHNYPTHYLIGVDQMILACMVWSPVFKHIVDGAQEEEEKNNGSDSVFIGGVTAAVLHGIMNATGGLSLMFVKGGSDLSNGAAGWAGIGAFAVADLGIWYYRSQKK